MFSASPDGDHTVHESVELVAAHVAAAGVADANGTSNDHPGQFDRRQRLLQAV